MGINWDVVNENAKKEADDYASKYQKDSEQYAIAFSGYFAGRLKCAAERESLRQIVFRLEKSKDSNPETKAMILETVNLPAINLQDFL